MRRAMVVLGVVLAGLGLAASASSASPSATSGDIFVRVTAPPSVEPTLSAVLLREGSDATAELCVLGGTEDDPRLMLECDGIPVGQYSVVVSSTDPAVRTSMECNDIATPIDPAAIPLGTFLDVGCNVVASRPGVLLGDGGGWVPEPVPAIPSVRLLGADGAEITDGCEVDLIDGTERIWCIGLPDGVYTGAADFPAGYLGSVRCGPSTTFREPPGQDATVVISSDEWLWTCVPDFPAPPFAVTLESGVNGPVPGWFDDVTFRVVTAGTDVSSKCQVVSIWTQPVPPPFVTVHCLDLEPGRYTVTAVGVPATVRLNSFCDDVEVSAGEPASCHFFPATDDLDADPDPGETPDPGEDGVEELPATGFSMTTLTALALVSTSVGLLSLLVARRRRCW